jgi:hypothetical protein
MTRPHTRPGTGHDTPPDTRPGPYPLLDVDLIACTGGVLDGQWFTRGDWLARRAATAHCEADTGIHGPALDYLPGPATTHPVTGQDAQQALWTPPDTDTDEDLP